MATNRKMDKSSDSVSNQHYLDDEESPITMADAGPDPIETAYSTLQSSAPPISIDYEDPDLKPARGGFKLPTLIDYGQAGEVISIPRSIEFGSEISALSFSRILAENSHSPINLFEIFDTNNPPTEIFPPPLTIEVEPTPIVSINDTQMNTQDLSVFTVSIPYPHSGQVSVAFQYPSDVEILGGTGLVSHDPTSLSGVINIPAGDTAVSLIVRLLPTSTLEPGENFQIEISDDAQGIVPIFAKPIGTSMLPADPNISISATDDIFWTALNENKNYNVTFVIDISGSMNFGIATGDDSRLDKAKNELVDFIELYDDAAENLMIHIIPFSSNANNQGAFVYSTTDINDAKDYVLKQGAHQHDGLSIGMINPNTGEAMGRGTQYNDALYHTRLILENDIIDPHLADFAPKVYFFSDGRPNPDHGATDNQNWPASWSPWQTFIDAPQAQVPNSFVNKIDVFAISLGLNPSIAAALQAVASTQENVFAVDEDLAQLNQKLLKTVPEYLQGNILDNDHINITNVKVTELIFQVPNASQFIIDNHLEMLQASSLPNNNAISIPLPLNGDFIKFPTPLEGIMQINAEGEFFYLPPKLTHSAHESFNYQVVDSVTQAKDTAMFEINTVADSEGFHTLVGDLGDNVLSTTGLQGAITMSGAGGHNTFVIDLNSTPNTLVIHDLFENPNNVLKFIGVTDENGDGQLTLDDIFTGVQQSGTNATLHLDLNTHGETMALYLDNPGDFAALNLQDTFQYLEQHVIIDFA